MRDAKHKFCIVAGTESPIELRREQERFSDSDDAGIEKQRVSFPEVLEEALEQIEIAGAMRCLVVVGMPA